MHEYHRAVRAPHPSDDRRCHVGPGCRCSPSFQAELYRAIRISGRSSPAKTLDTCAHHLADTVDAMARWASETGFGRSILQIIAVDTVDGDEGRFLHSSLFATISLPA